MAIVMTSASSLGSQRAIRTVEIGRRTEVGADDDRNRFDGIGMSLLTRPIRVYTSDAARCAGDVGKLSAEKVIVEWSIAEPGSSLGDVGVL